MSEPVLAGALAAAAEFIHDDECNDGTVKTCGRWLCGSDSASRFHSLNVGHVEFYREKARAILEAAAPVILRHAATRLKAECADEMTAICAETVLEACAAERERIQAYCRGQADSAAETAGQLADSDDMDNAQGYYGQAQAFREVARFTGQSGEPS